MGAFGRYRDGGAGAVCIITAATAPRRPSSRATEPDSAAPRSRYDNNSSLVRPGLNVSVAASWTTSSRHTLRSASCGSSGL